MHEFSGRFKEKADNILLDFHSSIHFDSKLYFYDIVGSIIHARGLEKASVITKEERQTIETSLKEILKEIENEEIIFSIEYEDIHMNIEKILIDKIGDIGKKLHTGRSRNDQVALDMRLFARDKVKSVQSNLLDIINAIHKLAKNNTKTYMPGFTHLQKAQPITFSHYILAYAEMFRRDYSRLENAYKIMNISPLGSAALAGTSYPLDRHFTSKELGFDDPCFNSIDGVSDRDYLIEIMNAFAIIMMHLSRMAEEIIIYSSSDFGYLELSDSFSTGSSIMPQKKNPDAAELVRGKTGRVYGNLLALLTTMKGIPLAYNKDMQEDKECFFDSVDTVTASLKVTTGMLDTLKIKNENLLKACNDGFINATDIADYLTEKGLSFRDAYKIVGSIVAYCIDKNITLESMSIEEYKNFSPLFGDDIYGAIDIKTCVEKRKTFGSTNIESIENHIKFLANFLDTEKVKINENSLFDIIK